MDAKTESTRARKRSKHAAALSSLALISASYPFRMCFVASLTRPKSGSDQLFQPQRPSGLNLDTSTKVRLLSTGAAGAQSSSVPSHLLSPQLHPQLTKMVGFPRLPVVFLINVENVFCDVGRMLQILASTEAPQWNTGQGWHKWVFGVCL